jgi:hypothetical protein
MRKLINLTDETIQRHTILFEESEVILTIRFFPKTEMWCFDAQYKEKSVFGLKLSVGVLHMVGQNQPFDFIVSDNSNNGIDPFRRDDFSGGRCSLFILDTADMTQVRNGAEVPI